ncbi:putative ankyrin repeat-containing protein [Lasiodiplodia theobromae]|uniref:Serine/threonine-protein phosphatase 6 regulatory ankyrin repeat subunit C n=1 Tax=Lasiodiplodia theobromae TaxID=45133 RepID=A0A5N5CTM8_9PEZI|nr:putative ankyrin repeat-containing protein [Lasiodiplodia theobromae]KAB2568705.1 Serine/threonine-protein phosphatase 6 regulatory ankyrin repeat subunit C [Lasiodiplodia theobromae]KAF4539055.1 putative ankyrin repeat-containing protein [Lasiodiplodia theobromae]
MPVALAVRRTNSDDAELLEMLLDAGASIPGTAALHMASFMGHLPKMRTLIVRGADINEVLTDRVRTHLKFFGFSTPLHWAVRGGHADAVELLLAENPDMELKDDHGISARDALNQWKVGSA